MAQSRFAVQVVVGQQVAVEIPSSYTNSYQFGYVVKKVTPKGQVVAAREDGHERRFDSNGFEMNSIYSSYRRPRLVVDVEEARRVVAQREQAVKAANLIEGIKIKCEARSTYSKETMLHIVAELEAKIAEARAAVEAM